ncbi:MAG TPA: hypothetical protein VMR45_04070 [Patescibacteria group bacterium]|nr:hypothetical protein [Patescibacteria group bacterium]
MESIGEVGASVEDIFGRQGTELAGLVQAAETLAVNMGQQFEAATTGSGNEHTQILRERLASITNGLGAIVTEIASAGITSQELLAEWGVSSMTSPQGSTDTTLNVTVDKNPETPPPPSIHDKNLQTLQCAEMSAILLDAYNTAITVDPRLKEVEIVPIPADNPRFAFATPAWASPTGKHQVNLHLEGLTAVLDTYRTTVDRVPGARKLFAAVMGVEESAITPMQLYIHSIVHELGHIPEYIEYEQNPEQLRLRKRTEKEAMPAGRAAVSHLLDPSSAARQALDAIFPSIASKLGIQTFDQLIELQHRAYRNLTSEKRADDFAARCLAANPALRDRLAS